MDSIHAVATTGGATVPSAPWWAVALIGGAGVVIGAFVNSVAGYFSDKRKFNREVAKERLERIHGYLAEFIAAADAMRNVEAELAAP
ncbi:hypothetical protein [Mycobacterium sp. Aquia_213]|uniref:hypothetical protein n=1 Tax=Mycobacterium sp. Aquia_213 TaxID=2991728 RepID=UPI00227117A4|nr:hypothetical protein [Mycobacterium sp. Aquia_213]WAC91154.1 hypothetical protein LMQ14_25335 [Mycobacterium sp. Aquia_213]